MRLRLDNERTISKIGCLKYETYSGMMRAKMRVKDMHEFTLNK